jgi:Na+(H+)/acetate symporter ActP
MMTMINALGIIAALSSAAGGFTALSLAMDRHWEALHGRGNLPSDQTRRRLRWSGSGGLLVSLLVCLSVWGPSQGWVAWAGMLTASAIGLVLVLSYAARVMVRVGWVAGGISVVTLALRAAL